MTRSYISAVHDHSSDKILVWERPIEGGERSTRLIAPPRYFYIPDVLGQYRAIDGTKLSKLVFDNEDEYNTAIKQHKKRYESDVKPLARVLMDMYYEVPTPLVNYAFLDIEVDYSSKIGFSSPDNPYAPINAITIYQSWTGEYLTYAVPPKGFAEHLTFQAKIEAMWAEHKLGFKPNVKLCADERELLLYMLGDLEDSDIVSGWNSEFFDIPYIIKRLERVLGAKAPAHMCFKGAKPPRERIVNRFGSPAITYTLHGRTHLDYLDLFKKFTFEGRVSYSLGNIAAEELDVPKLDYEGTLEQLYNRDFVHFVTYNARDVEVLVKLDLKFKFMQLVNQMAHENTVPFEAILGTVRYVETGIMNRAHNKHNLICMDKQRVEKKNKKVEGAIVMTPFAGLFDWLGSVDITSLYPSVIRALNMSIETFIGQFTSPENDDDPLYGEMAWAGINAKDDNEWAALTVEGPMAMTGAEWHEFIREMGYAISAFGTLFDQSKPGMVADTLTFWFSERKRLQAEKKKYAKLAKTETDPKKKAEYLRLEEHYDLLQLTKKIQLNSTYGALLNEAFRFGRREIGASVTGTGRQITKHMAQTIATKITGRPVELMKRYQPGEFNEDGMVIRSKESIKELLMPRRGRNQGRKVSEPYAVALQNGDMEMLLNLPTRPEYSFKKDPESGEHMLVPENAIYWPMFTDTNEHCNVIIYGDTDSCYFKTLGTGYEDAVQRADNIAEFTNSSFPEFMSRSFNCLNGNEKLIAAAREIVGERGLFLRAKKKYTIKVVNLDGVDLRDKPKLKSMGSEIKKADTPKVIQDFLKGLMNHVLDGADYGVLEKFVNSHRGTLIREVKNVLDLAPAKQVNDLDSYYAEYQRTEKIGRGRAKLPGHVRAAVNYNEMILAMDQGAKPIKAGDKIAILYLKPNYLKMTSIAFPADMVHLPEWFNENFQVDMKVTETKMIDSKLDGIFEALDMELPTPQQSFLNSTFGF